MTNLTSRLNQIMGIEGACARDFQDRCRAVPHYVLDPKLVSLVHESPMAARQHAYERMVLGENSWPFPTFLVEATYKDDTHFVIFDRHEGLTKLHGAFYYGSSGERSVENMMLALNEKFEGQIYHIPEYGDPALSSEDGDLWVREWAKTLVWLSGLFAFSLALKGVAQEKVEAPERLNKARAKKGKPPIREFTVMRIGQVYDKSGKAHAYTGRTMPVHLRAGHSRRQHYGRGNHLVKTISVPPTIVNFTPGADIKMPKRVITVGKSLGA